MTKYSVNSGQTKKSKGERLGIGSFELSETDSYSRQKVRADFFYILNLLEPDVVNTLYKKAYSQFILFAWNRFPETIPLPVSAWLKDKSFLLELERVVNDFTALPYNAETKTFHPVFLEFLAPAFSKDQELVTNHMRDVLMGELLRLSEELTGNLEYVSLNWESLQRNKFSAQIRKTFIEWSKDWNLNEDWCLDFAVAALKNWLTDRSSRWDKRSISLHAAITEIRSKNMMDAHTAPIISIDESVTRLQSLIDNSSLTPEFHFAWRDIDFRTSHWDPLSSYRNEWVEKSEQEFTDYLRHQNSNGLTTPNGALQRFRKKCDEYLRKIEGNALQVGLMKTPRRWADEHLTWAVRFQVQRWPMSKIVENYSEPRKTIADGINKTLEFIGLTRRPDLPHGMPKGTRLKPNRKIVRN
ncbi:MAG: hypothetical protein M3458_01240 [Acidobacteriota bacterium]|nr:hypothetical protein [Acidobacteriota bacterium]